MSRLNQFAIDTWAEYADRVNADRRDPDAYAGEAIAELEHCKEDRNQGGRARQPDPASIPEADKLGVSRRYACWLDVLGIDSLYDYDPVWRKCEELGYPANLPLGRIELSVCAIRSANFVYNHIGHFGEAGDAVAKALFIGGVTRRFPRLRFAFLEGGVAWGCALLAALIGHWEKRNKESISGTESANLDREGLAAFFKQYASPQMSAKFAEFDAMMMKGGWAGGARRSR